MAPSICAVADRPDFVLRLVERDRGALERDCRAQALHQPVRLDGSRYCDANLDHGILPARSVIADHEDEIGRLLLQPASLWEDFSRRRLLRTAVWFAAPIATAQQTA